jgi:hypothetical protein
LNDTKDFSIFPSLDISLASETFVGAPNCRRGVKRRRKGRKEKGKVTDLDVAVSLEIKHGKAADVPEPIDMDSELAEKVDDSRRAWRQRKPKDEWCQHDASKLRRESDRLHSEKFAKLRVHNLGV